VQTVAFVAARQANRRRREGGHDGQQADRQIGLLGPKPGDQGGDGSAKGEHHRPIVSDLDAEVRSAGRSRRVAAFARRAKMTPMAQIDDDGRNS